MNLYFIQAKMMKLYFFNKLKYCFCCVIFFSNSICMAGPQDEIVLPGLEMKEKPQYLFVVGESVHNFGRLNLLDYLPPPTDAENHTSKIEERTGKRKIIRTNQDPRTGGFLTHVFTLTNWSSEPITISGINGDCSCVEVQLNFPPKISLPYTVPPKSQIEVKVAIDPYKISGGEVSHQIDVCTPNQKLPLAVLKLYAIIDNGTSFGSKELREDIVKLSALASGSQVSRLVYMTLDSRLPLYFPQGVKLRLVSDHSNLAVTLLSSKLIARSRGENPTVLLTSNSVDITDDIISFTNTSPLPEDCILAYRVTLSKGAPPGEMNANLVLAASKPSPYGMLRHIVVPVQGFVRASRPTPGISKNSP